MKVAKKCNGWKPKMKLFGLSLAFALVFSQSNNATAIADPFTSSQNLVKVPGHIPNLVEQSHPLGHLNSTGMMSLALVLPIKNSDELHDLVRRLYDVTDPLYGKFITPTEFTSRFCPTQAEYERVIAFARSKGFTVTATHPNRRIVDITAPAKQVENAFGVSLMNYQSVNGRSYFAPNTDPSIPKELTSTIEGVIGLDNATELHPSGLVMGKPRANILDMELQSNVSQPLFGNGYGSGLTPYDIKAAYNLTGTPLTGAGQTLGLFELDGYNPNDIANYESGYGIPAVPLQNIYVNGYSGAPSSSGTGPLEVTLDIELMAALAPQATRILVYEAPNTLQSDADLMNRIATDNLAKEVSISWGATERVIINSPKQGGQITPDPIENSENNALLQMAAQGQSVFASSGDHGSGEILDPATQPYLTSVGGTTLSVNPNGTYLSEVTWNNSTGATGGSISRAWKKPAYQNVFGSLTNRAYPDVSLDADPNTGYSIFLNGQWTYVGGTSCAAPLWAAFTSLVNQQRTANGTSLLGLANWPIYQIGYSSLYSTCFHDITLGNNGGSSAGVGYDAATGWGSFNGNNLLASLVSYVPPVTITNGPTSQIRGASSMKGFLTVRATVNWTTNVPATGTVTWGYAPGALTNTINFSSLSTSHSADIIFNGTVAYFAVSSSLNNYIANSTIYTIRYP